MHINADDSSKHSKNRRQSSTLSYSIPSRVHTMHLPHKNSKKNQFDIPNGGYGWVIVLAIFLINVSTWGANSGFAIYLAFYLRTELFTDSAELYALIGGLAIGSGVTFSPVFTYLTGKIGIRPVMIIGAFLQLGSNLMASWSVHLWQIFLTQGLLAGFGMAMLAMPAMALLPQWFKKKRTLAGGLAASGSGAGGIMYNLSMSQIMQKYTYKWALRTQGIMCFSTVCVAISLIRVRSTVTGKGKFQIFDASALSCFGFWMSVLWVTFTMFGYVVIKYTLADFTHSLGFTSSQGSVVSAMTSAGGFFIRPVIGIIADKYGVVTVNIIVHILTGIFALAMWIPCRNYGTAIAFAFIEGGIMGSIYTSCATVLARISGLKIFPVFFGMVWFFLGIASIVSPVIGMSLKTDPPAGMVSDPTQYRSVSIFVGCCYFGAALSLWTLRAWLVARDELTEEGACKGHTQEKSILA
ncbi:hypothetical protein BABINDRAFT_170332 [Babjeviella inositovora NRRL Y-12698]|uniref:Major facilitator superfamily (MFS) profile domain-containing protein n=1 Tax=Babjeviella inositovora NRRL Y-12698 TaxID=984486 RepID=A0A1E3QVA2_9ASCO|nr:uncharacterized protein BABINDRAFT_170332 [Babjeviella inositovora NRRL Y-12698]ODQ81590.1 hypothetical protein BABINDRAFT_170332 [Babjeviella inositovora NRRL Y-12698]